MIISYRTLYHEIFEISQILNDLFAVTNFVIVGYLAVVTLVESFGYFGKLRNPSFNYMNIIFKFEALLWNLSGIAGLYMLIHPCVEVTAQVRPNICQELKIRSL